VRQRPRLAAEGAQPAPDEIGAEVGEQQKSAEQEEGHDQNGRDEADEDIRQDQLSAHPPQQPPLHDDEEPHEEVPGADRDRNPGDGIDDRVERRQRTSCDRSDEEQQQPDREAHDHEASGERMQEDVAQPALRVGKRNDKRPRTA
jgi:hypothetical protein